MGGGGGPKRKQNRTKNRKKEHEKKNLQSLEESFLKGFILYEIHIFICHICLYIIWRIKGNSLINKNPTCEKEQENS